MNRTAESYDAAQRARVLSLTRAAVHDALRGRPVVAPTLASDEIYLQETRGCFVSLYRETRILRGCIGTFAEDKPLWRNLIDMGPAATRDPRFVEREPVTVAEWEQLSIEVSVLTPRRRIDDPAAFRVGVEGIRLHDPKTGRSGCYLPQVAAEQGWDAEQALSSCCAHKMGLAPGAWRTPGALTCWVFESVVVSESQVIGEG